MYSSFVYSGILFQFESKVAHTLGCNSLIKGFNDPKNGDNNINGAVSLSPKVVQFVDCSIDIAFETSTYRSLNDDRVGLVTDFEYVIARNEAKSRVGRLQVVDGLPHVTF